MSDLQAGRAVSFKGDRERALELAEASPEQKQVVDRSAEALEQRGPKSLLPALPPPISTRRRTEVLLRSIDEPRRDTIVAATQGRDDLDGSCSDTKRDRSRAVMSDESHLQGFAPLTSP